MSIMLFKQLRINCISIISNIQRCSNKHFSQNISDAQVVDTNDETNKGLLKQFLSVNHKSNLALKNI
ncbi:unnamed protein product [Paramecium sonneborni]|uniref:Uncharacterized protein n=1 Tax=Paramecium sonneborni TaxID=65129 RepID=A0A8S1MQN8_9CILI|nr:unnamed protein product [Paramecium sonneborni]